MTRALGWTLAACLVVLASRTVAYALEPSPLARTLGTQAGGPRLWTVAAVAFALGLAVSAAIVWLAALGVEERRRLEPRAQDGPQLRLGRLALRAGALSLASSAGFALLESTLHWHAGLGWHGLSCLTGPVHRNALPVLVALSVVASAAATAVEHVAGWMRRTLARLAAVVPAVRLAPAAAPPAQRPRGVAVAAAAARGPPGGL